MFIPHVIHSNFQLAQVGLSAKSLHPQTITLQSRPTWQMENMEALSVWTQFQPLFTARLFCMNNANSLLADQDCFGTKHGRSFTNNQMIPASGSLAFFSYRLKPIPSEANQHTSLQPHAGLKKQAAYDDDYGLTSCSRNEPFVSINCCGWRREGSGGSATSVHRSFACVCVQKSEWCPYALMKKAQFEEWVSSPGNKSPGRKIIRLCASNNPSQPCLLTTPHPLLLLLLLPCLSCKPGEQRGWGPHCLLTNMPFSRLGPHWWIIQALPSALLRFLIKVRR